MVFYTSRKNKEEELPIKREAPLLCGKSKAAFVKRLVEIILKFFIGSRGGDTTSFDKCGEVFSLFDGGAVLFLD